MFLSLAAGFVYMESSQPMVSVELFYDHLCIDSKANWPLLKQVLETYKEQAVEAIIHIYPLPYHHNAYFMQQAGVVVRHEDIKSFIPLLELVFANQASFLAGAVNETEPQVQSKMADLISDNLATISREKVLAGFADSQVTTEARYAWKYAASRGITGTPQFIVNGVHVPTAADFTAPEWEKLIGGLLAEPWGVRHR